MATDLMAAVGCEVEVGGRTFAASTPAGVLADALEEAGRTEEAADLRAGTGDAKSVRSWTDYDRLNRDRGWPVGPPRLVAGGVGRRWEYPDGAVEVGPCVAEYDPYRDCLMETSRGDRAGWSVRWPGAEVAYPDRAAAVARGEREHARLAAEFAGRLAAADQAEAKAEAGGPVFTAIGDDGTESRAYRTIGRARLDPRALTRSGQATAGFVRPEGRSATIYQYYRGWRRAVQSFGPRLPFAGAVRAAAPAAEGGAA